MKMRRFLALALALSMLVPYACFGGAYAVEIPGSTSEDLPFDKLGNVNVDLDKIESTAEDIALEQEMVDENGMVTVFIIMEGKSVIEEDASAVLDEQTQEKVEQLEEDQAEVVAEIESSVLEGESLQVSYQYTWLFNGVAADVPYDALKAIRAVDGVEQVIVAPVYELHDVQTHTVSDGTMIGREDTWASGYTGMGTKIAVIDTGLDVDHQNFQALSQDKLTEDSATIDEIEAVLGQLNASVRLSGLSVNDVYYNSKVVFGFNYADNSTDITHDNDLRGDHGTHVAGIAAANRVEGSDVIGVAPDAQLYIMKVFGNKRAGDATDIIAALEDALLLGVDVVNMSLGTNAGFTSSAHAFINTVYERVAQTNTVLSVSAGNNYTAGFGNIWGTDANTTANPDNAVIGEPGVYTNVLSVASVENCMIVRNYIDVSGYRIGFVETSYSYGLPSVLTLKDSYSIVHVPGYGAAADFEGLDLTGKIALVQRGVESFATKCQNAADAGAVACFVYNNTSGEFGMDLTDCTAGIPCVSIPMADGEYIVAQLASGADPVITFPEEPVPLPSPYAYQMSDFSSWGLAPDLSLEPDITAPGGNVYSTINDGQYGVMSGTSMAAPNISGLSALVMQYVRENFGEDTDYRTMVQNLLVSTSSPLPYGEDGLYYSPRSQGSGLANGYNAVGTYVYLTVDGMDSPKVELGADTNKTGVYGYVFKVTNFGTKDAYYALNTVAQSEGYVSFDAYKDVYFMSSTPVGLDAATGAASAGMVLTYDVDGNAVTDSHDAYYIYRAAMGQPEDADWTDASFRYDLDCNDAVESDDVQNYLNALVGLDYEGDLEEEVLCVQAGQTAEVSVDITLADSDKDYLDTYYPNGGYVEGFTFLTGRSENTVDLSLPYLAFYGDWDAPPMIDDGNYWDLLNAPEDEVVGNQYWNVLFTNFNGQPSYVYPGFNVYVEETMKPEYIAVSPNGDGFFDTIDDIYTSLLRNAKTLTYRYTNMDTGEVYYEQTGLHAAKSIYSANNGQIIPNVYSWYEGEILLYDWLKPDGTKLENSTNLLLEVEVLGTYEGATPESWAVPIFVDLEAPELLDAVKTTNEDGTVTLDLTFRDNHYVSCVALMDGTGENIYYMEKPVDPEPDADGYRTYTASFDITNVTGKAMILLGDYAMNQGGYGLNVAGEGTPYGDLVAYQYNFTGDTFGWVSFNGNVNQDEVQITMDGMNFVCAEYVNGFVFAQTETGALYGIRYSDLLMDSFDLEASFIAQLENTYQDLTYNYADGKLYGLNTFEDGDDAYSAIYSINIHGAYYDADRDETVAAYQETWEYQRGGLYGLCLASDDNGEFYILGVVNDKTELWISYERSDYDGKFFKKYMSIDVPTDYLQSMTWDHNTETIYWAQFSADGAWKYSADLYQIDVAKKTYTKTGSLTGETCAMFAPLTAETAAKEEHSNVPQIDTSVIATPTLRDSVVTMNVGGVQKLIYDMVPWYSDYKSVVWSSSDPSVAIVDQTGTVTAVGPGSAVITVANAEDETKATSCSVQVSALSLKLEGIVTTMGSGIGNSYGASLYKYEMINGVGAMDHIAAVFAPDAMNFGLDIATSVSARGYIWACEYGNTGMVYKLDSQTGEVVDVLMPMDGDMLFGMTYNEDLDSFAAIMNMYLFVDLELTHEEQQKMLDSYDEAEQQFMYHRLNMLPYLLESDTGFVTNETGQGASSEVVMCGITTLMEPYAYVDTMVDFMGNPADGTVNYTSTQTFVILDNVGRLWYVDEICGLTKQAVMGGYATQYTSADGKTNIQYYNGQERNGLMELENEDGTYNLFYIRCIEKTPLHDMFLAGQLPRITYHFSDIEFAGYTEYGAPMFALSLYDYWNNGTTNELYLYVGAVTGTDEQTGEAVTLYEDRLYNLGDTGRYSIIASIHSATVTGGVDLEDDEQQAGQTYGLQADRLR